MICLMVVLAISADARWPRGMSDFSSVTLPCPAWVNSSGWSPAGVRWCKLKNLLHSVSFVSLTVMNLMPLGAPVHSSRSGSYSSSMVAGRSSTIVDGPPAEKIVLSHGATQSAVYLYAGVKDCWS